MNKQQILNKLIAKKNITTAETKLVLEEIISGNLLSSQIAAFLVALRMKGETIEEIVGLIQAMRKNMVGVDVQEAIDVCGTGGDSSNSFNISTAVALVVAGAGVKIAKHGNRAASSTCGSADVLEALGVNITLTAEQAKRVIEKVGMVFLFAPLFHSATKQVAIVRKELKIRTIFNLLGPFVNPVPVNRQLIGVPSISIAEKLIKVGKILKYKHLIIVTGEDGMDEISLSANTHVFELKNNRIKKYDIDPEDYGFKKTSKKEFKEGTLEQNAKFIEKILNGVKNSKRDIVVINSALAFIVAGKVSNIEQGIMLAKKSIDSGAAGKVLENLIKETDKYAK